MTAHCVVWLQDLMACCCVCAHAYSAPVSLVLSGPTHKLRTARPYSHAPEWDTCEAVSL